MLQPWLLKPLKEFEIISQKITFEQKIFRFGECHHKNFYYGNRNFLTPIVELQLYKDKSYRQKLATFFYEINGPLKILFVKSIENLKFKIVFTTKFLMLVSKLGFGIQTTVWIFFVKSFIFIIKGKLSNFGAEIFLKGFRLFRI